ncbi:hypothetical protein NE865_03385 [Phthorimaea operculella]|nr:hypothetical protein NE865_03385 [Phthorimaea operculella]
MKFVLLFSAIAIFATKVDNFKIYNEDQTQKVLLRKLQNFQQNETLTVTWNEILADVLVAKITRIETNTVTDANNGNILTKCFSGVLWTFKTYIYDKFWTPTVQYDTTSTTTEKPSSTTFATIDDKGLIPPTVDQATTDDPTYNPKSEVELIVPRYHGKIEDATPSTTTAEHNTDTPTNTKVLRDTSELTKPSPTVSTEELSNKCPEGSVKDKDGNCVDPITSKYILFVPKHCPIGYRRDKLGFCREIW